jgi:hypothetical protein
MSEDNRNTPEPPPETPMESAQRNKAARDWLAGVTGLGVATLLISDEEIDSSIARSL